MLSVLSFRHCPRIAAAMLLAALGAGCVRPLAVQHEFFSPVNGSADRISTQTQHAVNHRRALQAARHACGSEAAAPVPPEATNVPAGPNLGFVSAREALVELCDSQGRPPVAAYGGVSNGYRRWVEDEVRELPEVSDTAASAAGGS